MSETQKDAFQEVQQAEQYIQSVREHYRADHGEYRGRRNPEQQAIAEMTADEARLLFDGAVAGILALTSGVELPPDYEEHERAGHTWAQFRGEYERLMAGFGVLTNRLNRDGYEVPSYIELSDADRIKVASAMFGDFLEHNGLWFGATGSGVKRSSRRHTDDGEVEVVISDKDKAKNDREIEKNMRTREYSSGVATHVAGKMSPAEYVKLRKAYPEMDKDEFDRAVGFYTNAKEEFEERGQ